MKVINVDTSKFVDNNFRVIRKRKRPTGNIRTEITCDGVMVLGDTDKGFDTNLTEGYHVIQAHRASVKSQELPVTISNESQTVVQFDEKTFKILIEKIQ